MQGRRLFSQRVQARQGGAAPLLQRAGVPALLGLLPVLRHNAHHSAEADVPPLMTCTKMRLACGQRLFNRLSNA